MLKFVEFLSSSDEEDEDNIGEIVNNETIEESFAEAEKPTTKKSSIKSKEIQAKKLEAISVIKQLNIQ